MYSVDMSVVLGYQVFLFFVRRASSSNFFSWFLDDGFCSS